MKYSTTHKGKTMQIQLTQDELKQAVRQFISKDFNLAGRSLTISFTATRGDQGVITNLVLTNDDETVFPGYTDAPEAVKAQANGTAELKVINSATEVSTEAKVATASLPVAADTATTAAAVEKTEPEQAAQQEEAEAAVEAAPQTQAAEASTETPKTTQSLFG